MGSGASVIFDPPSSSSSSSTNLDSEEWRPRRPIDLERAASLSRMIEAINQRPSSPARSDSGNIVSNAFGQLRRTAENLWRGNTVSPMQIAPNVPAGSQPLQFTTGQGQSPRASTSLPVMTILEPESEIPKTNSHNVEILGFTTDSSKSSFTSFDGGIPPMKMDTRIDIEPSPTLEWVPEIIPPKFITKAKTSTTVIKPSVRSQSLGSIVSTKRLKSYIKKPRSADSIAEGRIPFDGSTEPFEMEQGPPYSFLHFTYPNMFGILTEPLEEIPEPKPYVIKRKPPPITGDDVWGLVRMYARLALGWGKNAGKLPDTDQLEGLYESCEKAHEFVSEVYLFVNLLPIMYILFILYFLEFKLYFRFVMLEAIIYPPWVLGGVFDHWLISAAVGIYAWGVKQWPDPPEWTFVEKYFKNFTLTRRNRWKIYFCLVAYMVVSTAFRIAQIKFVEPEMERVLSNTLKAENFNYRTPTPEWRYWFETQTFFNCSGIRGSEDWHTRVPNQTGIHWVYTIDWDATIYSYMMFYPPVCCEDGRGNCMECLRPNETKSTSLWEWGCVQGQMVWGYSIYGFHSFLAVMCIICAFLLHCTAYCSTIIQLDVEPPPDPPPRLRYLKNHTPYLYL